MAEVKFTSCLTPGPQQLQRVQERAPPSERRSAGGGGKGSSASAITQQAGGGQKRSETLPCLQIPLN